MSNYYTHAPETVFQAGFWIPETDAWGTPDTDEDPVQFSAMTLTPTVNMNRTAVEVQGSTLPVGMVQGIENTTWQAEGPLCWEDIRFLSGILPTVTATSVTGGLISNAPSDPNSYTLQYKDIIANGCVVSGFSIKGDTKSLTATVNFIGKKASFGNDEETVSTAAPTLYIPYKTTIKIGSAQSEVNDFELTVSDIWKTNDFLGTGNTPSQVISQGRCDGTFNAVLPYDKALLLDIYSDTGEKSCEITNETVLGSYKYTFGYSFKALFENHGNGQDTDNIYTIPVTCKIKHGTPKAMTLSAAKTSVSSGD